MKTYQNSFIDIDFTVRYSFRVFIAIAKIQNISLIKNTFPKTKDSPANLQLSFFIKVIVYSISQLNVWKLFSIFFCLFVCSMHTNIVTWNFTHFVFMLLVFECEGLLQYLWLAIVYCCILQHILEILTVQLYGYTYTQTFSEDKDMKNVLNWMWNDLHRHLFLYISEIS